MHEPSSVCALGRAPLPASFRRVSALRPVRVLARQVNKTARRQISATKLLGVVVIESTTLRTDSRFRRKKGRLLTWRVVRSGTPTTVKRARGSRGRRKEHVTQASIRPNLVACENTGSGCWATRPRPRRSAGSAAGGAARACGRARTRQSQSETTPPRHCPHARANQRRIARGRPLYLFPEGAEA